MVDSKCDVLLATRNFPPLIGGMERLNHFLYLALKEEYGVAIVGPSGCEKFVEPGTVVSARDARRVRSFLLRSSLDLIIKARTLRPKVVLAGSGLMGLPATMAARVCGAKTICYIHGLDIVAPDRIYQKLFVPAIGKIDSVWANSKNTMRLASQHGVREENMVVIPPPVQMPSSTTGSGKRFRERYGLLGKKLLLSVGRLTPRKGLVEFAEKVMPPLIERVPEACLVVIGGDAQDAVKRSVGELQRLREVFEARGLGQALQVIGRVDDRTLTEAYASSDTLILPVREMEGDVEGFGMVAIEAAAHGLPTVAFSSGGVPDAVEHGVSGYLVEPDDYDAMLNALIAVLSGGHDPAMKATSREFAGTFALDRFNKRVCDQLAALIA